MNRILVWLAVVLNAGASILALAILIADGTENDGVPLTVAWLVCSLANISLLWARRTRREVAVLREAVLRAELVQVLRTVDPSVRLPDLDANAHGRAKPVLNASVLISTLLLNGTSLLLYLALLPADDVPVGVHVLSAVPPVASILATLLAWRTRPVAALRLMLEAAQLRQRLANAEAVLGLPRMPPPLSAREVAGRNAAAGEIASRSESTIEARGERPPRRNPMTLWNVWAGILAGLALIAVSGRLKGSAVFGWGVGTAIGLAVASVLFGALLLLIAQNLWKVQMTFGRAYTLYFAGAALACAPPLVFEAFAGASVFYPRAYLASMVVAQCLVPPLFWANCQVGELERIGPKRAVVAVLLLAPVGFVVGFLAAWLPR